MITAGGRINGAFAELAGTRVKALARVRGITMLQRMIDALRAAGVNRLAVVGGEEVRAACADSRRALRRRKPFGKRKPRAGAARVARRRYAAALCHERLALRGPRRGLRFSKSRRARHARGSACRFATFCGAISRCAAVRDYVGPRTSCQRRRSSRFRAEVRKSWRQSRGVSSKRANGRGGWRA